MAWPLTTVLLLLGCPQAWAQLRGSAQQTAFRVVDGGAGRACRGADSSDSRRSYYTLFTGLPGLESCLQKCMSEALCKGVEYIAAAGRCEVWTRPEGIESSVPRAGALCLAYIPASTTTTTTSTTIPVVTKVPCESSAVVLDFHNTLVHNNLGGLGPDTGAEHIRYSKVGHVNGTSFDLVITATSDYTKDQHPNGLAGKFGIINVKAGTSIDANFTFEETSSGRPVALETFLFSFFDVDGGYTIRERLLVKGYEKITLSEPSDLMVAELDGPGGPHGALIAATAFGGGCDNPKDPLRLNEPVTCDGNSVDLRKRTVTFLFANRSSFTARLRLSCDEPSTCRGGRNFLFAGSSSLLYSCEEAPLVGNAPA